MKKYNVLFILTDDQRFDTIHALGNDQVITPNMDWLVENGTCFTQAHIPGGTSGAVCMPSRAMIHTGRSLFELENCGSSIPCEHKLLGEVFQDAGYDTFGTGKWHNGSKAYARSFTGGDNIFYGGMHDHWCVPTYHFDPTGLYERRIKKVEHFYADNRTYNYTADHIKAGEHSTDFIAEGLISYLEQPHDNPFFAYNAFLAPHDPRTMPDEFRNMYDANSIRLPENFQEYHSIEYGNTDCRDELLAPYPRTVENTKRQIAEYYGMISHVDHQIGNIIQTLKKQNLLDSTIIILAGDNGLALGQHGLFGKQSLYDHSVRIPLIFCGPNIPKGEKREDLVFLSDIFPTLCEMLQLPIPESVTSKSFAPCFDKKPGERKQLYLAYTDKIRGIVEGDKKYIEHRHEGKVTKSLYHLKDDPWEMANLAGMKAYQEELEDLRQKMKEEAKHSGEMNTEFGQNYWKDELR